MKNRNLGVAKKNKNDEFYTQLLDIENELRHYKEHFKGKIVYCNCDSTKSNFYKYFTDNFEELQLKELIISSDDFRDSANIENLNRCDIVVTNPPFSLFRDYVAQLIEYNKKFLIIGNQNAITYKKIFKLLKENLIWLGISYPKVFIQLDGSIKKFGNIGWFTNLEHNKPNEWLVLTEHYEI